MSVESYDYAVVGGDHRQVYLAKILREKGYKVCTYGLCEEIKQEEKSKRAFIKSVDSMEIAIKSSKNILAPIPLFVERNGEVFFHHMGSEVISIQRFIRDIKEGQTLFAGCIPEGIKEELLEKGVTILDYMKRKELAIYNSIATAEGVLAETISKSFRNIHGSNSCVIGYGVCGKTIVQYLKSMHANVTVCVRREEAKAAAEITADKAVFMESLEGVLRKSDFVFNTVPEQILDKTVLKSMKKDGIIFDIASGSGGIDLELASEMGIKAYSCKGLPGKYAPKSSAEMMAYVVEKRRAAE